MFQPGLLKGKKILVTGGGTGLGASMGHRFLELGAELVICGRRKDVLEETAARFMKETGGKVTAMPCDVRDAAAVEAMMDDDLGNGSARCARQQCRRQFHRPDAQAVAARHRCDLEHGACMARPIARWRPDGAGSKPSAGRGQSQKWY